MYTGRKTDHHRIQGKDRSPPCTRTSYQYVAMAKSSTRVDKLELMNNKLINTLLPLNKEGELDRRYEDNIKSILIELGSENADVLSSFYENTTKLEKEAGNAALKLALCILKHVEDLEKNHKFDSNDNYI